MSAVTPDTPALGRPTDTELATALGLAALGKLTPEAATGLAERLAGASAARSAHARAAGLKGTGPQGPRAWYRVMDAEGDEAWARDLSPVAAHLGLSKGSLQVYLNRGGGRYDTKVDRDGREVLFGVRYATEAEKARLNAADAVPMWEPPAKVETKRRAMPRSSGVAR